MLYYCVQFCDENLNPESYKFVIKIPKETKDPNTVFLNRMMDADLAEPTKVYALYYVNFYESKIVSSRPHIEKPGDIKGVEDLDLGDILRGIIIPPKTYADLYDDVMTRPEYWRFRFFRTEDKDISDFFLTSEIPDVIEYMNSEEFAKEFYSPEGIGGKRDKEKIFE